jgi:hypothetical protein
MKIFATIFAIFIFSLSVNAFGEIGCLCEKYVVTANMDGNTQSGHDDGCTAGCSPFHLCNTCSGFTISPAFHMAKPALNIKPSTPISHTRQFISAFYGNIWQPPKIG